MPVRVRVLHVRLVPLKELIAVAIDIDYDVIGLASVLDGYTNWIVIAICDAVYFHRVLWHIRGAR